MVQEQERKERVVAKEEGRRERGAVQEQERKGKRSGPREERMEKGKEWYKRR